MPDLLAEVARINFVFITEWGESLERVHDNLFHLVQILVEQRAALNLEFRGPLQHQRRQLRWTGRQFRRFFTAVCASSERCDPRVKDFQNIFYVSSRTYAS